MRILLFESEKFKETTLRRPFRLRLHFDFLDNFFLSDLGNFFGNLLRFLDLRVEVDLGSFKISYVF